MPKLFFHLKGKKNIEYEADGGSWKAIPYGWYTAKFLNACLEGNQPLLEEMTGQKGIDLVSTMLKIGFPVALLVGDMLTGGKCFDLEAFSVEAGRKDVEKFLAGCFGKRPSPNKGSAKKTLAAFLSEEMNDFLEEWLLSMPRPFIAQGGRFGWLCQCKTEARAAVAEMVLGYVHGWKAGFRFCTKCGRFYHGEECERCFPEKRERERLLGLLRAHKHRFKQEAKKKKEEANKLRQEVKQKREEAADHLKAAAGEVEKLQERLRKGSSLKKIVDDYLEICKRYDLPTGWVENYKGGSANGRMGRKAGRK